MGDADSVTETRRKDGSTGTWKHQSTPPTPPRHDRITGSAAQFLWPAANRAYPLRGQRCRSSQSHWLHLEKF